MTLEAKLQKEIRLFPGSLHLCLSFSVSVFLHLCLCASISVFFFLHVYLCLPLTTFALETQPPYREAALRLTHRHSDPQPQLGSSQNGPCGSL